MNSNVNILNKTVEAEKPIQIDNFEDFDIEEPEQEMPVKEQFGRSSSKKVTKFSRKFKIKKK